MGSAAAIAGLPRYLGLVSEWGEQRRGVYTQWTYDAGRVVKVVEWYLRSNGPGSSVTKPDKEQILDHIDLHLSSLTLEQISIAQVARELQTSPRHIFRLFRTKIEIADALAVRHIASLMKAFADGLATGSPEQKLAFLLASPSLHWIKTIEGRPGMASVLTGAAGRRRRAIVNLRAFILEKLETILAEGQKAGDFRDFDVLIWARTIFDLMAVVADPRMVHLAQTGEITARADRIVSFILWSVLRDHSRVGGDTPTNSS
jgi:AcrR family transcriptional regulator